MIKDIDKSTVLDAIAIESSMLGGISAEKLSGRVKALLLMKNKLGKVFNSSSCGDNCDRWIMQYYSCKIIAQKIINDIMKS